MRASSASKFISSTMSRSAGSARQIADALGLDAQAQTRVATAASEIGRNALHYAGGATPGLRARNPQDRYVVGIAVPKLKKLGLKVPGS